MKRYYLSVLMLLLNLVTGCSSELENHNVAKADSEKNEQNINSNLKSSSNSEVALPNSNLKQTPTFTINEKVKDVLMVYKIRGINQKFGYIDKPLTINKENKLEWVIWKLSGKPPKGELIVKATQDGSSISTTVKGKIAEKTTPLNELPKDFTPKPVSFNKEMDKELSLQLPISLASTTIKFSKPGNWELQVYIDDKQLGSINVYVANNEQILYYLND